MTFLRKTFIALLLCCGIHAAFGLPPLVYRHVAAVSAKGVSAVHVKLPSQSAVITIGSGARLKVATRIYAFADSDRAVQRFAKYLVPKLSRKKNVITLSASRAPWPYSNWSHAPKVTVHLFIPQSISVDYVGQSGSVKVQSRAIQESDGNSLDIRTGTGPITVCKMREGKTVKINSKSGDVFFHGFGKLLKVRTVYGSITVLWTAVGAQGQIHLNSSSGHLLLGFDRHLKLRGSVGSLTGEIRIWGVARQVFVGHHMYRLNARLPALLLYARNKTGSITIAKRVARKKGEDRCALPTAMNR